MSLTIWSLECVAESLNGRILDQNRNMIASLKYARRRGQRQEEGGCGHKRENIYISDVKYLTIYEEVFRTFSFEA